MFPHTPQSHVQLGGYMPQPHAHPMQMFPQMPQSHGQPGGYVLSPMGISSWGIVPNGDIYYGSEDTTTPENKAQKRSNDPPEERASKHPKK